MEPRINLFEKGKKAITPIFGINQYLKHSSIGKQLIELIDFRISQINQCSYCLDMHSKELRAMGETEQRLYGLSAWRETPYFTERERAALEFAEGVNALHVSDEVYENTKKHFSEEEMIDLTLVVNSINIWNRFNIVFRQVPGDYQVGMFG
ncbi:MULTISPECIES: carboxymuconolactone decarboxylase family protein [Chryseobacterium]|uniref:AhpD family alkylhydroperoxidase n=1 Tax=Chryseobacterium geocarposphaerae TaxID=1416776 RepID=A0ABU1LC26_9FLAO|nr:MULTISPECIES: carboxymuconolactone decarboxylase family protein [Chryseobacterium]MDR6404253.1 AhpD family alkylhydroperoxidase [Chryseobacterium geocarposphaerae]MDR6699279.1 AhpD family alkylhydroperoxidase [Chryseobacterium ginsenosidimutans]